MWLGIDVSSQAVKVELVDSATNASVFSSRTPFTPSDDQTPDSVSKFNDGVDSRGVLSSGSESGIAETPAKVFFAALDHALSSIPNPSSVTAISGCAQQHTAVHWSTEGLKILESLCESPEEGVSLPLAEVFPDACFTSSCPTWQDSNVEAAAFAKALGTETRFTLPQVLCRLEKGSSQLAGVSLLSAAVASVLTGKRCPPDAADAAGTGAAVGGRWNDDILKSAGAQVGMSGERLKALFGDHPVATGTPLGVVGGYAAARWGFSAGTVVAAFTGDNPASMVATAVAAAGHVPDNAPILSLGTSDTFLGIMESTDDESGERASSGVNVFTFPSPLNVKDTLAMLVYSNGSLMRESVAKAVGIEEQGADSDMWAAFNKHLSSWSGKMQDAMGVYALVPEATPPGLQGIIHAGSSGEPVNKASRPVFSASDVSGVVLSRAVAVRVHGSRAGLSFSVPHVIAVGGASANHALVQQLANGLNSTAWVGPELSAAMGTAFLAGWASAGGPAIKSWPDWAPKFSGSWTSFPPSFSVEDLPLAQETYARLESKLL